MFDELSADEVDGLSYKSYTGAFWYIYDIVLGNADHSNFELGKSYVQKKRKLGI